MHPKFDPTGVKTPDHDSIFHVTEMPALTTKPSVTSTVEKREREIWVRKIIKEGEREKYVHSERVKMRYQNTKDNNGNIVAMQHKFHTTLYDMLYERVNWILQQFRQYTMNPQSLVPNNWSQLTYLLLVTLIV